MLTDKQHFILRLRGFQYTGEITEYIYLGDGTITGDLLYNKTRSRVNIHKKDRIEGLFPDREIIYIADKEYYTLGEMFVWI